MASTFCAPRKLVAARYCTATQRLQTQEITRLAKNEGHFVQRNRYVDVISASHAEEHTTSRARLMFLFVLCTAVITALIFVTQSLQSDRYLSVFDF